MSRHSLQQRLALLFVVVGGLTAALVALVAVALSDVDEATRERVGRFDPALLETAELARAYSDQETGLRGYLVAGEEDFLAPYRSGRAEEARALDRLRGLLDSRPDLRRRVDDVAGAARAWRQQAAAPAIERVRAGGALNPSPAQVAADKERFDEVRAALRALRQPVAAAQRSAAEQLADTRARLRVVLIAGLALLVVAGALTWWALRRWVVRPLHDLGDEVDRVQTGDLSRKVTVAGAPAEIAELAGQVDRMRMRILHEYALAEAAKLDAEQARAVVEEQAEDLRRSNAELEQFAYVASHDLQEPLRKVASFCQLLERRYKGQLDARGEQYIEFAVDGAKRMQRLINDLLAFSRVGRRIGDLEVVDLEEVIQRARHQLDVLIEDAGAEVTHEPLPVVHGDPTLLVQLLQNLIGNGVKFRSDQPPRVHIGVTRTHGDGYVELYCRDNGIGIDPQYEDKIFVIFQRLHSREAYDGTGIGLAMCKKIVEFHGGRLWLETGDGEEPGSTFRFTLPLAEKSEQTSQTDPATTKGLVGR